MFRYEQILDEHRIRYRKPYADKENQNPAPIDNSSSAAGKKDKSDQVCPFFLSFFLSFFIHFFIYFFILTQVPTQ